MNAAMELSLNSGTDCVRDRIRQAVCDRDKRCLRLMEKEMRELLIELTDDREKLREIFTAWMSEIFLATLDLDNRYRLGHQVDAAQVLLRKETVETDQLADCIRDMLDGMLIQSDKPAPEKEDQDHIERLKTYIHTHLDSDLSLQKLSDVINYNPSYLSRLFRKKTGMNLYDYIERTRMEKAKQLLIESDYQIKDIGQMVGYGTPRYFSYFFKRFTNMSPSEFQKQYKQKGDGGEGA